MTEKIPEEARKRKRRQHKKPSIKVSFICVVCKKTFYRYPAYIRDAQKRGIQILYCSRTCQITGSLKISDNDYADIISAYQSGRSSRSIAKDYDVCPETIIKVLRRSNIPIRKHIEHFTFGLVPHPTKGIGHTEEAIEKIRAANLRQFSTKEAREKHAHLQIQVMAEGRVAMVSQVEQRVAREFDKLGISYKQQWPINNPQTHRWFACVDFMLNNTTIVEVNGTYYHSDPRFYPDGPVSYIQKRIAETYASKLEIFKELGITVIEIWEHDINADISAAVIDALSKANFILTDK